MATLEVVHLFDDSVDCGGGGKTSLGNLAHKGHSSFSGETSSWKHKSIWYYLRLRQKHKHFVFWLDFHRQVAKAFTSVLDFSHFLQALAFTAVFYLNNSLYVPQIIGMLEEKKTPFIDQKYTSEKVPNFGNARKSSCFFSQENIS